MSIEMTLYLRSVYNRILDSCIMHDEEDGGCWEWMKHTQKDGYGQIKLTYEGETWTETVHRVMYMLHNGKRIGPRDRVSHICRLPSCVNPKHLYIRGDRNDPKIRGNVPSEVSLEDMKGFTASANEWFYGKWRPDAVDVKG